MGADMSEPNFKQTHYRNKKILQAARDRPCQYCGRNDWTTVAAHSNAMSHGKGVGIKAHDCYIAFLCSHCHSDYDSHKMPQMGFDMAMERTWLLLLREGILR